MSENLVHPISSAPLNSKTECTLFGGWKENVKKMCKSEDMAGLEAGHKLWKVRKKHFIGITWKHRKFRLNFSDLCIHYGEDKVGMIYVIANNLPQGNLYLSVSSVVEF